MHFVCRPRRARRATCSSWRCTSTQAHRPAAHAAVRPLARGARRRRPGAGGERHRDAGDGAVQDADGDHLPPVAAHLGDDAPHGATCRTSACPTSSPARSWCPSSCRTRPRRQALAARAARAAARQRRAQAPGRALPRVPRPAAPEYRREGGRRRARGHGRKRWQRARLVVCGVDEAGRGPLAGPVYAAAVILDPARRINGLADSKVLSAERRELLAGRIRERAVAWAVASASVEEIDAINILRAALLAMRRAVEALSVAPRGSLDRRHPLPRPRLPRARHRRRRRLHKVISAASILAKTARDAEMRAPARALPAVRLRPPQGLLHPGAPRARSQRHGPCEIHRRSFEPVRVFFEKDLFSEGANVRRCNSARTVIPK